MSFLVIARERYALPIGDTSLGGEDDDALPAPELRGRPVVATIAALPDGTAALRRVSGLVTVDGVALGEAPLALAHGMRLDVAGVPMLYGDRAANGSTAHVASVPDDDLALLAALSPVEPTATTGGRLVAANGTVHLVPDVGLDIGRDPGCGLPLVSKDVSRLHARIVPGLLGYLLTDVGANGTFVNGAPIDGTHLLGNGDVIRIGPEALRFFADPATFASPPAEAPIVRTGAVEPVAPTAPAALLFATLEVLNTGVLQGTRFRIERPVAHVGRGPHNDVRLVDESVSGSHATVTRRATGWIVLDLGSTNGTYVDGTRITGEARLAGACELRFGNVKLLFRPIQGAAHEDAATRALVGVPDEGRPARS